jgi:hypothetical protein
MSTFFSGSLNPFWPHVLLLTGAILASFAVAGGIVLENPKWSLANVLVVGGVAIEAVCTLLLFGFDEGISNAQQSKIVMLETRLQPRSIQWKEFEGELKGQASAHIELMFVRDDPDSWSLAQQFFMFLMAAGWNPEHPRPIPQTDDSDNFFGQPPALLAGAQPSGVTLVVQSTSQEERDAVTNWRSGKAWTKTPLTVLEHAIFDSLGTVALSSGAMAAPSSGTIRIVVAPRLYL